MNPRREYFHSNARIDEGITTPVGRLKSSSRPPPLLIGGRLRPDPHARVLGAARRSSLPSSSSPPVSHKMLRIAARCRHSRSRLEPRWSTQTAKWSPRRALWAKRHDFDGGCGLLKRPQPCTVVDPSSEMRLLADETPLLSSGVDNACFMRENARQCSTSCAGHLAVIGTGSMSFERQYCR